MIIQEARALLDITNLVLGQDTYMYAITLFASQT